jgi:hypothetical protein
MPARSLRFAACIDAYGAGHLSVFIGLQVEIEISDPSL